MEDCLPVFEGCVFSDDFEGEDLDDVTLTGSSGRVVFTVSEVTLGAFDVVVAIAAAVARSIPMGAPFFWMAA